jgi:signal transduction histidine kinase
MDIAASMIEYAEALKIDADQFVYVETIYRRADAFIGNYLEKQSVTIQELRRYLSHDARTPLTVIIGCCDLFISGTLGEIHEYLREAMKEIRQYAHALHQELYHMHEHVWGFMQQMGIEK